MGSRNEERDVLEGILAGLTNPTHLPLALLQDITENFSEKRKIGEGGFGEVYKGELRNGNVAVKRIVVNENTIDDKLFYREVKSMMKIINHPNVVRFLGFCSNTHHEAITRIGSEEIIFPQKRERLLCFEYISNGSLDKLITDELRGLEWDTRYQIIKEICEGLSYLHNEKGIIHMDLNPSNILLDDQMVPKITDFGLARLNKNTHTLGLRFRTRVYCAPEYEIHGKISNKCDLYSLGVIITELVTGYKGIPDINKVLRRWRHRWTKPPTLTQYKQVSKCIEMAICCRKQVPEGRPLVRDILHHLRETETKNGHNGQMDLYSEDDMLGIEPLELQYPFDHKKQISWSVELTNGTSNYFAFNIESPRVYGIQPNKGIVPPRSKCNVEITVQAQERTQQHMLYADDQFIVQSTKVNDGLADENITDQVFNTAAGKVVDEVNLAIVNEREKPKVDLSHEAVTQDIQCRSHKHGGSTNQPERPNFHTPESSSHSQRTKVSHLPKGSNPAVDLATGAMGSLLPKLGELLKEKYNLEGSMRTDVKTLESQLTWMQLTVRKVSKVQPDKLDDLVKIWAKEVRELSYHIEDVIDSFLSPTQGSEPAVSTGGFRGLMHKMLNHFKWGKAPREIRDVIQDMKNQVQVVADAGKLYEVDGAVANPIATTAVDPRLLDLYKDQRKLVGIDGATQQLTEWLTHVDGDVSQLQLKILSIFGCGGLGKTTLARVLYDKLKEQFNCTAFVTVGRDPDVRKIYRDILIELDKRKYLNMNITILDVKQLIDELRGILKNKRYFIVIDDIWDIESWQVIKCALMDDNIGSRIITSTRIFKVAEKANDVYKLQPLSRDRSEELLWNTLLYVGGKGKWSNDEPIEVMNKILQKCGGVPLAIITIASLLASKPRDDWSKVYNSIGFGHGENIEVENTRKILLFSYYDLPLHLRSCLLHLSIYPEDYSINKDILIWKWVAEGFVHEEPCIGLFELGERYFNELINRSMIHPIQDYRFLGGIRGCRVHDMVLDIICLLAEEENFVTIWDISKRHKSPRSKVRRLAMQKIVMEQCDLMGMSQLRSFNVTECHLSMTPSLGSFLGLRVLYLKDCTGWTGDLQPVVRLVQLRYLGLIHKQIVELPSELGDLIFLQTLNLSGCHFGELPRSVGRLRNLKCLCLPTIAGSIKVPFPLGDLVSLEKLSICHPTESPNLVKEFYKLTELRELRIDLGRFDHSSKKSLLESLNNLQNIRDLELDDYRRDEFREYLEGYMPPKRLARLKLPERYLDMPSWVNSSLVPNLSRLSVSVRNAKDLEILGRLPDLIFLQLYMNLGSCLEVTGGGAFPKLRHCESDAPLRFQQGTMPKLETIQFMVVVADLKGANFDFDFGSIGNLLCLQRVLVQMHCQSDEVPVSDSEVEEAEAGLRHSVDSHPNRPSLSIKRHGYW